MLGDLGLVTHTHLGGSAAVYHLATPPVTGSGPGTRTPTCSARAATGDRHRGRGRCSRWPTELDQTWASASNPSTPPCSASAPTAARQPRPRPADSTLRSFFALHAGSNRSARANPTQRPKLRGGRRRGVGQGEGQTGWGRVSRVAEPGSWTVNSAPPWAERPALHPAAVLGDGLGDDGQSETGARGVAGGVGAVEAVEDVRQVGLGDARALVGHPQPVTLQLDPDRFRPAGSTSPRCPAGW